MTQTIELLYLFRDVRLQTVFAPAVGCVNSDWFLGYAPGTLSFGLSGERCKHEVDGYLWLIRVELSPPGLVDFGMVDLGKMFGSGKRVTPEEALAVCPGTPLVNSGDGRK